VLGLGDLAGIEDCDGVVGMRQQILPDDAAAIPSEHPFAADGYRKDIVVVTIGVIAFRPDGIAKS